MLWHQSKWRRRAAPIIERVLAETRGQDEKTIRAALRAAYPFGPRKYWAYKVWADEVRRQRGLKRRKPPRKAQQPIVEEEPTLFGTLED